jgi:hypothetical protein
LRSIASCLQKSRCMRFRPKRKPWPRNYAAMATW